MIRIRKKLSKLLNNVKFQQEDDWARVEDKGCTEQTATSCNSRCEY